MPTLVRERMRGPACSIAITLVVALLLGPLLGHPTPYKEVLSGLEQQLAGVHSVVLLPQHTTGVRVRQAR